MTLNLMLTSRDAVYLSGDFRLTSVKDQMALPDSYNTQKLIPVIRRDWAALVAYIGVASAPPLVSDVGQWILDQMDSIPPDGSFSELARCLLRFNVPLGKIRGDRRIAFSVVGFWNHRPFMMLLSNFLNPDGGVIDAGPQIKAHLRRSNQPEVRAVGTARPDVFERVRLERLLQAGSSPRSIPEVTRKLVAEINASVARRSRGSISEECVSGYLLRSGSAAIGGHGIPEDAACFPNWVRRDLEKGGVVGFEPVGRVDGKTFPIHWKGTIARTWNGKTVRMHEIANAGNPIVDNAKRQAGVPMWKPPEDNELTHLLRQCLQHAATTGKDHKRAFAPKDSHLLVLHQPTEGSICIVKKASSSVRPHGS